MSTIITSPTPDIDAAIARLRADVGELPLDPDDVEGISPNERARLHEQRRALGLQIHRIGTLRQRLAALDAKIAPRARWRTALLQAQQTLQAALTEADKTEARRRTLREQHHRRALEDSLEQIVHGIDNAAWTPRVLLEALVAGGAPGEDEAWSRGFGTLATVTRAIEELQRRRDDVTQALARALATNL